MLIFAEVKFQALHPCPDNRHNYLPGGDGACSSPRCCGNLVTIAQPHNTSSIPHCITEYGELLCGVQES